MAGCGRITQSDLNSLVELMSRNSYRAKEASLTDEKILSHCLNLCGKDYKYSIINNKNGELCNHYPAKLILLEYETKDQTSHHESMYHLPSMQDLFTKARFARCRTRFVMPVILVEGKHICRSATISGGTEVYGRLGYNFVFNGGESFNSPFSQADRRQAETETQLFDRIRGQDISLLKRLDVTHICDLMLENKKVKYFLNVTSSEKVDKLNRYSDFRVWSLPYPGCEFFKIWRDRGYNAERSLFDWNQEFVNTKLEIPVEPHLHIEEIIWTDYKTWNLVQITRNYLKVILRHIQDGNSGLLIHCISGWDRTPLFVSLLRLSLWADGLVHKSLNALEILYLTVAYDWYQFGHNLPDRLQKGEEIFFFCFFFLKYIQEDEFIVHFPHSARRARNISRTDSDCATGILLEGGADFSLYNSTLSLSSETSRPDTPPQLFLVGCPEEDGIMTSHGAGSASYSSHPIGVPVRQSASACRSPSPVVGSWQVISRTGSFMDSPSAQSNHEGNSQRSSSSSGEIIRNPFSLSELSEFEPTMRRRRLEEVRSLFYHAYGSTIGFKNGPDPSSGISSLLDTFAVKLSTFKLN